MPDVPLDFRSSVSRQPVYRLLREAGEKVLQRGQLREALLPSPEMHGQHQSGMQPTHQLRRRSGIDGIGAAHRQHQRIAARNFLLLRRCQSAAQVPRCTTVMPSARKI